MQDAKYVVMKTRTIAGEYECMMIFSPILQHSDMCVPDDAISAGFVRMCLTENGEVDGICFGKSTSLNISSRPCDTEMLRKMLKLGDYKYH